MGRTDLSFLVLVTMACACGDGGDSQAPADDVLYPEPDWETASPEDMGFDRAGLEMLAQIAERNDSHCLFVTRKGRLVSEWYWDDWTRENKQVIHSVTKSIASTLVGIAQDRNLLDIEDRASDYIPEWRGTDSEDVTVRQLLSNDSGREWRFVQDYVLMAGFAPNKTRYAIDFGQQHEPGTFWEYNNSAIQTLDEVLRRATGEADVADFARDTLFAPLGMDVELRHDLSGNTLLYGEAQASCEALARFGYLFLRNGKWANGETIVSEAWVEEATSESTRLNAAYGLLWWLNNDGHFVRPSSPTRREGEGKEIEGLPESTFMAQGLGGQLIVVDREHEIVMTRIGGDASPLSAIVQGTQPEGATIVSDLGNALADAIAP